MATRTLEFPDTFHDAFVAAAVARGVDLQGHRCPADADDAAQLAHAHGVLLRLLVDFTKSHHAAVAGAAVETLARTAVEAGTLKVS